MINHEDMLDAAVQQHFCKLFGVLMVNPTPDGLAKFSRGLKDLAKMEDAVAEILNPEKKE